MNTATVMALGFLAIIAIGTLLLMLPISSASGEFTSPMTASFTAVSATCVTGLVVVESGVYWSAFGKCLIILLIQIGGLGFMTMAVLLSVIVRRSLSPRDRVLVAASYGITDFGGVNLLVKRILLGTLTIEGMGALLLSLRFIPDYGFGKGLAYSVFHSISAFCNAGFDIFGCITCKVYLFGRTAFDGFQALFQAYRSPVRSDIGHILSSFSAFCCFFGCRNVFFRLVHTHKSIPSFCEKCNLKISQILKYLRTIE